MMKTPRLTQSQFTSVDGNPSCSTSDESSSIRDRIDEVGSVSFSLSTRPSQGILKIGERRLKEKGKVTFDEKTVFPEREENPTKAIKYTYKAQLANFRFCSSNTERIKYFELIRKLEGFPTSLKSNPFIDTLLYRNGRPIPLCVRDLKPREKKTDEYTKIQIFAQKDSLFQGHEPQSGFDNECGFANSLPYFVPLPDLSYEESVADSSVSYLFCLCKQVFL
jgi:hypothetical protein